MDTIMEKISQKLAAADAGEKTSIPEMSADDMIRANSMADAVDKENLRNEISEYRACLDKLSELAGEDGKIETLIEEVKAKLDSVGTGSDDFDMKDSLHKEGVRIYKNVQASIVEYSEKVVTNVSNRIAVASGKTSIVVAITLVSLLLNIATVAFLVLSYLGIL